MKTEQLLDMLARGAGPAPTRAVERRLLPAMLTGWLASTVLAIGVAEPLPWSVFETWAPWIKLGYAAALLVAAGLLTRRLAVPLSRPTVPRRMVGMAVGVMVVAGAIVLAFTPSELRMQAVLGETWLKCPWLLMGFSLPALAALLWAVRGLAPTRPRQAGWACGVLAGALGAMGYALHCPETSVAFVAVWYTLGIVLTGLLGRWLGPRVLRW